MSAMRGFRFGFNTFAIEARESFAARCRLAERYGYDVVLAADHLGAPAPFPTLAAAAEVTERLRVGTLVLNVGFCNAHLLAREVATVDLLSGGRLELGLGAGHMKWEFDAAGIGWEGFGARVDRLEQAITRLGELFGGDEYPERAAVNAHFGLPPLKPMQRKGFGGTGPPLLIGGTGDSVLRLAARHADIVGHAGIQQIKGRPPGTFALINAERAGERVRFVREQAGDRADAIESNLLVQLVEVTGDRRATAAELVAGQLPFYTVDEALDSPFLLIGTEEQIAAQLVERRERYGYTYITVHGPYMEALGPVIERIR